MAVSETHVMRRRIHDIINQCVVSANMAGGDGRAGGNDGEDSGHGDDFTESFTESGSETGRRWVMETVRRHNGQVIIPVLPDGKVLVLVRYHAPAKKWLVGFPSGFGIDSEENWRDAAQRTLLGEAGVVSPDLRIVGGTALTNGADSDKFGVVLALKCTPLVSETANPVTGQQLEMSFECLEDLIGEGEVECCLTMSALTAFKAYRRKLELKRA